MSRANLQEMMNISGEGDGKEGSLEGLKRVLRNENEVMEKMSVLACKIASLQRENRELR